ncbi:phytanoyl-CoA dioxygenase [uncultured Campylobacter sp.]|uniref:phytanoyl-CoA dioxygenase n=1 Tax=uncultured Campylobacter sp. TaxID=218934 RepID=UPI0026382F97|nr:phytanoyl-CoA dioxygenase [uncultured Campylobacter sp.]
MQINGKEIFRKSGLMVNLCRMASLEYQVGHLIHPAVEYYESPSEMVEFLYTECKNALLEQFEFCFLPYERDALRELKELIDKYTEDDSILKGEEDGYYLVYQNKSWIEVRGLALKTLHIFGYKPYNFNYD